MLLTRKCLFLGPTPILRGWPATLTLYPVGAMGPLGVLLGETRRGDSFPALGKSGNSTHWRAWAQTGRPGLAHAQSASGPRHRHLGPSQEAATWPSEAARRRPGAGGVEAGGSRRGAFSGLRTRIFRSAGDSQPEAPPWHPRRASGLRPHAGQSPSEAGGSPVTSQSCLPHQQQRSAGLPLGGAPPRPAASPPPGRFKR